MDPILKRGPSIVVPRAPIAQLVELRTFNPQVPGSSPGGGTNTRNLAVPKLIGADLADKPASSIIVATTPATQHRDSVVPQGNRANVQ
jgi:hypothetical protein